MVEFFKKIWEWLTTPVVPVPEVAMPPEGKPIDWTKLKEGTPEFYRAAFLQMKQDPGFSKVITNAAKLVLSGKKRYQEVCRRIGWQAKYWWIIGLVHYKEASCSFSCVLHNGETLSSVNLYGTRIVPKGRGKGLNWTWEDAAVDALSLENLGKLKIFELGVIFEALERYNGTGYLTGAGKAETTPYLWGMSSVNDDYGIYWTDGKYDPSRSSNGSAGIAVILRELMDMGEAEVEIGGIVIEDAPESPDALGSEIGGGLHALAQKKGIPAGAIDALIAGQKKHRPGKNPRYWVVIDFKKHSGTKRFHLFDRIGNTLTSYRTSHGKGSDANHDGYAEKFSNVAGSNCSSLGFYRCAETYIGKHGLSLRLDGMEKTNSNARARAVVIHSADYVTEAYIEKYGKAGRSEGCPAIDPAISKDVIAKIQNGSPLVAWVN